jgi:hypothetical protein
LKNTCSASTSLTECFSFFIAFPESHSKAIEAGKSSDNPGGRPYMLMIYLGDWKNSNAVIKAWDLDPTDCVDDEGAEAQAMSQQPSVPISQPPD